VRSMGDGWGSTSDVPSPRPPQQLIIASKVIDTSFVSETGLTYEHIRTFRALSKSMKLFDDIDVQALDELSLIMKPLEFRSGEQLIKEGDSGSSMYFVLTGSVDVFVKGNLVITLKQVFPFLFSTPQSHCPSLPGLEPPGTTACMQLNTARVCMYPPGFRLRVRAPPRCRPRC